ncbi:MAG: hypothetical protein JOY51_03650, partial [Nevskia sp.]|nr:hypothetical protein [Nevskia sp.]
KSLRRFLPGAVLLFVACALLARALPGRAAAAPYQVYINGLRTNYAHQSVLPGEWLALQAQANFAMAAGHWESHGGQLVGSSSNRFTDAYWRSTQPGTYWVSFTAKTPQGGTVRSIVTIFALVPFQQLKGGQINGYTLGNYKGGSPTASSAPDIVRENAEHYHLPKGFIEITERNRAWPISPHFRLGDFVYGDDHANRIYAVLSEKLVQKLELLIDWMQAYHYPVRGLRILSGFRTPEVNQAIGRGGFSRHVFGDAADIMVDDWNRDGKVDLQDAKILAAFVEYMDKQGYYTGGMGVYDTTSEHGPFVHVDTRGYIARW